MAGPKLLKLASVGYAEEPTITTSAGATDANKVPALGADGKLDTSMIPASGGVTDAMSIAYALIFG